MRKLFDKTVSVLANRWRALLRQRRGGNGVPPSTLTKNLSAFVPSCEAPPIYAPLGTPSAYSGPVNVPINYYLLTINSSPIDSVAFLSDERPCKAGKKMPTVQNSCQFVEKKSRAAFTLFELIATLAIVGIGLAIIVGAYSSWGSAHGLSGATRAIEAGIRQARTIATTERTYVIFNYGTTNPPNNTLVATTGFQIFTCTNINPTASESLLQPALENAISEGSFLTTNNAAFVSAGYYLTPAYSFQRLTGHVNLHDFHNYTPSLFALRPDGSVINPYDSIIQAPHVISVKAVALKRQRRSDTNLDPLENLIRIDPATGFTSILEVNHD